MNKENTLEIASELHEKASPELRQYVFIEWGGTTALIIGILIASFLLWRFRATLEKRCDDTPVGHIASLGMLAITVLLSPIYITYTIKVFLTPELEAIKSIVSGF